METNHTIATQSISARKAIGLEATNLGAAELVSIGTSLGVVAVMDQLIPKTAMDCITKAVARTCIEPFLDPIEKGMSRVCKLEECKADKEKSREERAESLAKAAIVFSAAWLISLKAKQLTRRVLNEAAGIREEVPELAKDASIWKKIAHHTPIIGGSKQERLIFAADEGVHYGSLLLMNTKAANFTDDHIRKTRSYLEKQGFSEQKSKELANMLWIWEAPNMLGLLAGLGAVAGKHAYGWPAGHTPQSFADIVSGRAQSLVSLQGK